MGRLPAAAAAGGRSNGSGPSRMTRTLSNISATRIDGEDSPLNLNVGAQSARPGESEAVKQGDSRDGAALSAARSDVRSRPRAGRVRSGYASSGSGKRGQGNKRGTLGAPDGTGPGPSEDNTGLADALPLPGHCNQNKFGELTTLGLDLLP